jgi:hypothetical protein
MESLADHQASMQHEHGHDRVELEHGAFQPQAHWHLSQRPALGHPESHDRHEDQRHGDRYAFEVLRLPGRILGHHGDGYVEARETGQAAEDEEGKQEVIEGRAQTEAEGGGSGSDAEGDLHGVLAFLMPGVSKREHKPSRRESPTPVPSDWPSSST